MMSGKLIKETLQSQYYITRRLAQFAAHEGSSRDTRGAVRPRFDLLELYKRLS